MGGRGISFSRTVIPVFAPKISKDQEDHTVQRIKVIAEMNPVDRNAVNAEKTLLELEQKKQGMKREQLQILDEYGFVTTAYQGDESSVALDSYALNRMVGNIVTHNHPSVYGGTFSDADINTLRCGMSELRASAIEGTYSMKATKRADPQSFYKAYQQNGSRLQKEMKNIATQNAKGKYSSYKEYVKHNRQTQLAVLHDWYTENAAQHGYIYDFKPTDS